MDNDKMTYLRPLGKFIWWLVVADCLILLLCSCRGAKEIAVDHIRTDSMYMAMVQRDSVYIHDSVEVREKGDTIWLTKNRYHYVYKNYHDTIYSTRVDSIPYRVEVEKRLTWWQDTRLRYGGYAIIALVIVIGIRLFKLVRV